MSSLALIYLRMYLILCIQLDLQLFEFNKLLTDLSEIWWCFYALEEPTCMQMLSSLNKKKENIWNC